MSEVIPSYMGLRPHFGFWQTSRFNISLERTLVMGIVNVTPDSFSNEGDDFAPESAIAQAARLLREGADILDVGGESTRPGSKPLSSDEEWSRVQPVLNEVLKWDIPISIDTYHARNMQRALDLGVDIVNDIYALRTEGALDVAATHSCGLCLMHMHGEPLSMQSYPMNGDVTHQVSSFFADRLNATDEVGISRDRIVIDPGVGFGKTVAQNFQLLREQSDLLELKLPLMVGWSRKSSLGAVTDLQVNERLIPSVVAALIAVQKGATVVRVHDVLETVSALKVWKATNSPASHPTR
jgi:dihydropteroate synthase